MSKDYYNEPGLNASTLKYFAGDYFSPATAVHKMRNPMVPTQSMALGTAVHSILEHEMDAAEAQGVIDGAYKGDKPRMEWMSKAMTMASNVWNECESTVQSKKAVRERSHFRDGYKALIDLEVDGVGIDYKTTRVTTMAECRKEADKYNLEVQAWHYKMIGDFTGFTFIFVSSVAPHQVFELVCTEAYLNDFARPRWEQALERYNEYKDMDIELVERGELMVPHWYEQDEVFG